MLERLDDNWSVLIESEHLNLEMRADKPRPAASLIKLGLVCQALQQLDPCSMLDRSLLANSVFPSVRCSLQEQLTVSELCAWSLMTSDNACASLLLQQLGGSAAFNDWLRDAGYQQSSMQGDFSDRSLLGGEFQAVTTLREASQMLKQAMEGSAREWLGNCMLNSRVPALLPSYLPVWHKTGTLSGAVHDLAVVGDQPSWLIGVMSENQLQAARSSLQIAELALWARSLILSGGPEERL